MGEFYDLEEKRRKANDRAKEHPPFLCLWSRDGKTRVIPKWEKGPNGEWRIMHLETVKAMLGCGREESEKGED